MKETVNVCEGGIEREREIKEGEVKQRDRGSLEE